MKPKKSKTTRTEIAQLEDIPNIGKSIAGNFRQLGIKSPSELPGRDPYTMYEDLCRVTGKRHDPCLLDTFIAAVRFMEGEPKKPWWKYTTERKRVMATRESKKR
jgi:Pathogenicity locus